MRASASDRRLVSACRTAACLLLFGSLVTPSRAQWLQFGGPNRDFKSDAKGLADQWPDDGPPRLWSREIGSGHSSILVDGNTLYTMCRRENDQDAVLAINAKTGETLWETRYDAPAKPDMALDFGAGPHSTPLVAGDRLFAVGAMAHFHCLDKKTGRILWSHNLMEEMGASHMLRGQGASPTAYKDTVILIVGGTDASIAAFRQETGEVVWKIQGFRPGYASPLLVRFNNEDHLIVAIGMDRAGLDPDNGDIRWRTQVDSQSYGIMATPIWIPPDRLFTSASYGGGSRVFKIKPAADGYEVEESWFYRKMQVAHGAMVRMGDYVYGSSHGSFGPAFLMGINIDTGKPAWRERGFTKANVIGAGERVLILDEQGWLALATVSPEGLIVHSKVKVLEEKAWTAPTLVGTTLYLRDHHTIMALDLSAEANTVAAQGSRVQDNAATHSQ